MSFDMVAIEAPGATGSYNSALHAKASTMCDAMASGQYDFGFVHVKAVDDTGHDRMMAWRVSTGRGVVALHIHCLLCSCCKHLKM